MSDDLTAEQNAARGYTITRVMDAPRQLVWDAWTQPDQYAFWFGGHDGRMKDVVMDVRPGGSWSGTMVVPDGSTIPWTGRYLEVEAPARLVVAFADQEVLGAEYETFTVTLADRADGKTDMVVRQTGGHLTDQQYKEAEHGTGIFLDTMAELLAKA